MRTEKYNRCGLMFIGQCFGMLCLIGCRWVWVELCGWDRNRGGRGDLGGSVWPWTLRSEWITMWTGGAWRRDDVYDSSYIRCAEYLIMGQLVSLGFDS